MPPDRTRTSTDGSREYNRRPILRLIGAGAGGLGVTGTAYGRGPPGGGGGPPSDSGPPGCPDCPDGTRLLAKFEFEDGEFAFEKGACEDGHVTVTDWESKPGEDDEPIAVTLSSPVFAENVVVKYGTNCELASESDAVTMDADTAKDDDGFEMTLGVPEDGPAISFVSLCAGVCFQADLVFGDDIIEDLSEELYGDRKISVLWGGTSGEEGTRNLCVNGTTSDGSCEPVLNPADSGDEVVAESIWFDFNGRTVTAEFSVEELSGTVDISLVTYTASCPPEFSTDTAHVQDLFDWKTMTVDATGEQTMTVDIPWLDQLDELCDVDD